MEWAVLRRLEVEGLSQNAYIDCVGVQEMQQIVCRPLLSSPIDGDNKIGFEQEVFSILDSTSVTVTNISYLLLTTWLYE